MSALQVIEETIARMDDYELAERWRDGMFSDEAKPIVEREFQKRGISIESALRDPEPIEVRPPKPIVLPALFAAIGGGTAGAKFGGAFAGAIGAGLGAMLVAALGWKIGKLVALYANGRKSQAVRMLIYCVTLVVWFCLNAIVTAIATSSGLRG